MEVEMNQAGGRKQGKVSIITPCYNGEKYIGETIESVLAQTYEIGRAHV